MLTFFLVEKNVFSFHSLFFSNNEKIRLSITFFFSVSKSFCPFIEYWPNKTHPTCYLVFNTVCFWHEKIFFSSFCFPVFKFGVFFFVQDFYFLKNYDFLSFRVEIGKPVLDTILLLNMILEQHIVFGIKMMLTILGHK